jgi:uncharacterized LabA/DUF88 family protein
LLLIHGEENIKHIFAFIDSQNLNLGIKNDVLDRITKKIIYKGWELSFSKFYRYLVDKYKVEKAFLFIGKVKENEHLYLSLKKAGYSIVYKPTYEITESDGTTTRKGNVDAELVLHTMIEFQNFDSAIIVAGDGDYRCLIEYLHSQGKLDRILIPNRYSFSRQLKGFRKYFEFISDLRIKLKK